MGEREKRAAAQQRFEEKIGRARVTGISKIPKNQEIGSTVAIAGMLTSGSSGMSVMLESSLAASPEILPAASSVAPLAFTAASAGTGGAHPPASREARGARRGLFSARLEGAGATSSSANSATNG